MITNETRIDSVLQACGVWTDLRAACSTLVSTDPELIRSMTISARVAQRDIAVDEAICRFAEEQCLVAEVERTADRLVIRLRRQADGGER